MLTVNNYGECSIENDILKCPIENDAMKMIY